MRTLRAVCLFIATMIVFCSAAEVLSAGGAKVPWLACQGIAMHIFGDEDLCHVRACLGVPRQIEQIDLPFNDPFHCLPQLNLCACSGLLRP